MPTKHKRFKLILEYDGSRYSGWQKQKDTKTIQGSLLRCAGELFGEQVDIQGNGRTDAGVHALEYVAHLEAATDLGPQEIVRRLNDILPQDINILKVERAGSQFHARHDCVGRSYLYQIARRKTVFRRHHAWWVKDPLKVPVMREASALLTGMNDFSSFTDRQAIKKKSPLVMVNNTLLHETDDIILFRIVGSHFLWKMIRRIVGVLVAVGNGSLSVDEVRRFLVEPVNLNRFTAPAHGLFFERAFYNDEELKGFISSEEIPPAPTHQVQAQPLT
ncbi:MAG: tRNA pseudouridine(38-40) synthase TruA [Thermodesulfobacteriota bacterium]